MVPHTQTQDDGDPWCLKGPEGHRRPPRPGSNPGALDSGCPDGASKYSAPSHSERILAQRPSRTLGSAVSWTQREPCAHSCARPSASPPRHPPKVPRLCAADLGCGRWEGTWWEDGGRGVLLVLRSAGEIRASAQGLASARGVKRGPPGGPGPGAGPGTTRPRRQGSALGPGVPTVQSCTGRPARREPGGGGAQESPGASSPYLPHGDCDLASLAGPGAALGSRAPAPPAEPSPLHCLSLCAPWRARGDAGDRQGQALPQGVAGPRLYLPLRRTQRE